MAQLAGKVAIVTGAGSGIGRASAVRFAREGAAVVVADVRLRKADETAALITEAGGSAIALETDVSQAVQIDAMVGRAVAEYGRLDVLFNNAATVRPGTAVDLSEADWDLVWRTNVSSVFLGAKYAVPHMTPGSSIISTASTSGLAAEPALVCYGTSKAAVIALTRSLAVDFGPLGIRVNCICPGITMTPAMRSFMADDAVRQRTESVLPARRLGHPDDIAAAALWLAGDESAYVTGQAITVDGGLTAISQFAITQSDPATGR
jgi:NAD(P)-dependent dehydrogenase (short-subunit alcohol dehydrogenase family)